MPVILSYDVANTSSWPGSGTTLFDLSGQNNHGNFFSSANQAFISTSNGGYVAFNGINQYIYTTNQLTNPQNFSVGVWFRTQAGASTGKKLIGFETNQTGESSSGYDRQVWIGSDGKLNFGIYSGSTFIITSSAAYNDGNWHYVVATYTANSMKLYVDGTLIITGNSPATSQNINGYWRIGSYRLQGWTGGVDGYYSGLVSKVQVWNEVIDATQISTDYSSLFSSRFSDTLYPPAFYQNLAEVGAETLISQQIIQQQLLNLNSETMYQGVPDQQIQDLKSEAMYIGNNLDHQLLELKSEAMYVGDNLTQQLLELKAEVMYILPPSRKKTLIHSKSYNFE